MLKFLQTFALDFPYIYLQFFPRILVSRKKHFYRQVYKKWCKVVPAHAAAYKQGSFHFTILIFFRTVVLRKLFDITFWYKHCTVISHAVAVTGPILKIVSGAFSFLTIHMSSFTNALVDDKEKNWTLSIIKCEFKLTRVLFLSIPKIYNSDCYLFTFISHIGGPNTWCTSLPFFFPLGYWKGYSWIRADISLSLSIRTTFFPLQRLYYNCLRYVLFDHSFCWYNPACNSSAFRKSIYVVE